MAVGRIKPLFSAQVSLLPSTSVTLHLVRGFLRQPSAASRSSLLGSALSASRRCGHQHLVVCRGITRCAVSWNVSQGHRDLRRPSFVQVARLETGVRCYSLFGWMGQNASLPEDVKVVVVGGGYGGCKLGLELLADKANFTLIDGRDAFHHNLASVRALAVPGLAASTMVPLSGTFGDHFRRGVVVDVDPKAKMVALEGGDQVAYDVLVLATGTTGPFPFKFGQIGKDEAVGMYEEFAKKVKESQRIVLIGGGAVGVEAAAEIATEYPDKEVTIVHSRAELISSAMSADFQKRLNEIFTELKIKTVLGEKVANLEEVGEGPGQVVTDKGTTLEADLVIRCTGLKVNSEHFSKSFGSLVEANGSLKVNEFFQVGDHEDVFAIGDCCASGDHWLAYVAQEHAKKLYDNLKRKYTGVEMEPYKGESGALEIIVSLGRNYGIGQKKSGGLISEFMARNIKSKDLLVHRYWQIMKQKQQAAK